MSETTKQSNVTRRNFLLGAGALAATAVASGCTPAPLSDTGTEGTPSGGVPTDWTYEADIVIVGAGGAGHMAACAAHEEGASVLMLEKSDTVGGDTGVCACICAGPWPERTKADSGKDDTVEAFVEDLKKSNPVSHKGADGEPVGDDTFIVRQAEMMPDIFSWLENTAGVEWTTWYYSATCWAPQPGWDTVTPRDWTAQNGIIPPLKALVDSYDDVETLTETRVYAIIRDDSGRAVGVRAVDSKGSLVTAKARKAVILGTGTFNGDRTLVSEYLGANVATFTPGGVATVTGDGHRMVVEAGGYLRDMHIGTHWFSRDLGQPSASTLTYSWINYGDHAGAYAPGILVNTDGVRYCSENMGYSWTSQYTADQPYRLAYYIIDSTAHDKLFAKGESLHVTADTIEELGRAIMVDTEAFIDQVKRYNTYVEQQNDEEFGKKLDGCPKIETAPFYALPVQPQPYATYGGIAVDVDGHVLDSSDAPIPGLYAAGLCCGSFAEQAATFYLGGVGQALSFGWQAGKLAAGETSGE